MEFDATSARIALAQRGMTQAEAARRLGYNKSYVSRVIAGIQPVSRNFVIAWDDLMSPVSDATKDVSYRDQFASLLKLDSRFGGDNVAGAGLQLWKAEQHKLDLTVDPSPDQLSAVAEMAEVAGWLCHSAGRNDEARHAFSESLNLARQSRDLGMQWFATDMLAMTAIIQGRPGEALRLAESSLELSSRVPGRVAVMARVRRARALAMAGDHTRSWQEMTRAVGGLEDSVSDRDPAWSWWITPGELAGHYGEMLLALGQPGEAIRHFRQAVAGTDEQRVRAGVSYRVALLHALTEAQQWHEAESTLVDMVPTLAHVSSGMIRNRLRRTMRSLRKLAPEWLIDTSRDVLSSAG